jgi:hypothetical protein
MSWWLLALAIASEDPVDRFHRPFYVVEVDVSAVVPGAPRVEAAIARGNAFLGTPWRWEGRNTESFPDLDCLGLLYRAFGPGDGRDWKSYPVDPSKLVASGVLGNAVGGLDGVLRGELDVDKLRRGDVIYFLQAHYENGDQALLERNGVPYRGWHTGIYVGEDQRYVLNAHPRWGVVRMRLEDIVWDAVFVTRGPVTLQQKGR